MDSKRIYEKGEENVSGKRTREKANSGAQSLRGSPRRSGQAG
jgi:hypothetical protein